MKKILFGTLAAVALIGSISAASAQWLYGDTDEFGYELNTYGWYDPNSAASIGYNHNITDPSNVGG